MVTRTDLLRGMPCAAAVAAVLAAAAPAPAAADDDPMPFGGLRGEAREAAREGADGDRYNDPDRDPDPPAPRGADDQTTFFAEPPEDMSKEPGLLGDGEIVIEDGEVTEGLIEVD